MEKYFQTKISDRFKFRRKRPGNSLPHQPSNRVNKFLSNVSCKTRVGLDFVTIQNRIEHSRIESLQVQVFRVQTLDFRLRLGLGIELWTRTLDSDLDLDCDNFLLDPLKNLAPRVVITNIFNVVLYKCLFIGFLQRRDISEFCMFLKLTNLLDFEKIVFNLCL